MLVYYIRRDNASRILDFADDWVGAAVVTRHIIEGFTAFGTVAVAVLAIWGNWVRSMLAPAKLTLVEHTPEGDLTTFASGTRVIFCHLKVSNQRRWLPAQNC